MARFGSALRPQVLRSALQSSTSTTTSFSTPSAFSQLRATLPTVTSRQPSSSRPSSSTTARAANQPPVPSPTPFVPDVETFLKVIGRGLSSHASKFPTWEALFTLNTDELRELGIEPPRTRRYLQQWRQRFRRGQFGVGGDLQHIGEDGHADLRILEVRDPRDPVSRLKYVVNVPPGVSIEGCGPNDVKRVSGYKVQGARTIVGPYAVPLKNNEGARVSVTEGMWEDRRGHKVDGGERRRTEIRYKKRIAERREARERGEL